MNWHSATEFFAMGGYGIYVWSAYAATAGVLALEAGFALRRRRRALAAARERQA
ncbi:MAG: heme exporter protein CcmD [Burkholderiales bacterium]